MRRGSCARLNIVSTIEWGNALTDVFDQFQTVNGVSVIGFFQKIRRVYA